MTIRVVVADDQALVRTGFSMILNARDDIAVVGEAADGAEAVEAATRLRPDVVLMDARMPIMDGIAATRRLAAVPEVRVVILTTFDLDELVYSALRAGASGFLLKDIRPGELADAVRLVADGQALLAPTVTRRLLSGFVDSLPRAAEPPDLDRLTGREREVLRLVAIGLSNAEVGERLGLSEATVKSHVSAVLRKYELRDRVQAVILAYDSGLVRPRPSD